MTHLSATATAAYLATGRLAGHVSAWLCLAAAAAAVIALYLASCAVYPFTNCRRCKGMGRFHALSGRAWRTCRRCHGTGARLRTGRRIINHFRRLHSDATTQR
jgi:hypothetical protein